MRQSAVEQEMKQTTGQDLEGVKGTDIFTSSEMLVAFLLNKFRLRKHFHR